MDFSPSYVLVKAPPAVGVDALVLMTTSDSKSGEIRYHTQRTTVSAISTKIIVINDPDLGGVITYHLDDVYQVAPDYYDKTARLSMVVSQNQILNCSQRGNPYPPGGNIQAVLNTISRELCRR